jgi:hypothetical protein
MGETDARNSDAEWIGIGEVRQALLPRWMHLVEDQVAFRSVQCLPGAHPALEGAPWRGRKIAMSPQHVGYDAD